jgi:hypothetical protein
MTKLHSLLPDKVQGLWVLKAKLAAAIALLLTMPPLAKFVAGRRINTVNSGVSASDARN